MLAAESLVVKEDMTRGSTDRLERRLELVPLPEVGSSDGSGDDNVEGGGGVLLRVGLRVGKGELRDAVSFGGGGLR